MTPDLKALFAAHGPLPGLAAWSARLADGTLANECCTGWLKPAQVEQALTRLALIADGLARQDIRPTRVGWVFEHMRIHLALRQDGARLALFVENRPGLPMDALETVMARFQESGAG